jgi:hypothetical protein
MAHRFLFLTAMLDIFGRKVLSSRLSNTLTTDFCVEALEDALREACDHEHRPTNFLEQLHAVFPDAPYTCLYRNCVGVVHACLEIGKVGFMMKLEPDAARNPQNLVTDDISSFLGVQFENVVDKWFKVPHDQGRTNELMRGTTCIHTQSIGRGSWIRAVFIERDRLSVLNVVLDQLEYPRTGIPPRVKTS